MMTLTWSWLDQLLRHSATVELKLPWMKLLVCQGLSGFLYGMVMGSYGEWDANRFWYAFYAGIKVPLLFWVTFSLCVPVFFVLHALSGLHGDFRQSLLALLAAQAILTLVLVALAPLTSLWYLSNDHYPWAILFNGMMFAIASLAAQFYLRRLYAPLFEKHARHRTLLTIWLGLYLFVAIQFAWVLRPFVGEPNSPAEFFRSESWGNAYVALFHLLSGAAK